MSNSIIDDISKYYKMKKASESIPKIQSPDYVEVDLNKIIGKEYEPFWYSRERYRVVKGSRGDLLTNYATNIVHIFHNRKFIL